jgi:predicted metalloprotease with PDZ domain
MFFQALTISQARVDFASAGNGAKRIFWLRWKSFLILDLAAVFLVAFTGAKAQTASGPEIEVLIKIAPSSERIKIEGRFLSGASRIKNWTFQQSYADAEGLAERFSNLQLRDINGEKVSVKKFSSGEYLATGVSEKWQYEVGLETPKQITASAHISWLTDGHGIIMLNDLLPAFTSVETDHIRARVRFEMPPEWQVAGNEVRLGEGRFFTDDARRAVFYVGKGWRARSGWLGKTELAFAFFGEWQFTDDEATQMGIQILDEHRRTFGEMPYPKMQVILLPFPQASELGRWRAETRGATVTIVSAGMPFRSGALNRLHEQLRHEIFHFWIPNRLNLTGNYDWFFEGFTIYQALKTGLKMRRIRFEDFLDTVSRAEQLALQDSGKYSLIEVSENRWVGASGLIYSKGLLTAFLSDVAMMRESKGKRSLSDIFRELYRDHASPKPAVEANGAILTILRQREELRLLSERFIVGKDKLDIDQALVDLGIQRQEKKLSVREKLSGRQKDLLQKLGYEQSASVSENRKSG